MGLMGSIFGGVVGLALGGPLGAIAGAALGHGISESGSRRGATLGGGARTVSSHEEAQAAFFVSTFSMLAKMARADGRVSQAEIDVTRRFMREQLQLDEQAEQFAIRVFRAAKDSPTPFHEFADQFHQLFHREPEMLHAMLDVLVRLAMADGGLHPRERSLLEDAAQRFGLGLESFEHLVGQQGAGFDRYYDALGVSPDAGFEEVRSAYRKKVTEFHPDKVIAKGMPDEFVAFAQKRFQEIQEAYEKIREREGR